MKKILRRFSHARLYAGDCYVADYSEATHSRTGVVLAEEPFADIEAFSLHGCRRPVTYIGVNLEQHRAFIRGIENCECFFASAMPCQRPWLLMLELKYCKPRNLGNNSSKAIRQMASVLRKLEDEGIIDPRRYRIYFNYSSPANTRRQPFTNFVHTQSDALELVREANAYLFGFNELVIASGEFIRAPKLRI